MTLENENRQQIEKLISTIEKIKSGSMGMKEMVIATKAVEELGQVGGDQAIDYLITLLKEDSGNFIRIAATETLGKIGSPAIEPLITSLKNDDRFIRLGAAEALGIIGNTNAVEALIGILNDNDSLVRHNAVEALGRIGDSRAVVPLNVMLLNEQEEIIKNKLREVINIIENMNRK